MREIILKDVTMQVDDSDFDLMSKYRWWFVGGRYAQTKIDGVNTYAHRLIMGLQPFGSWIDHLDGNGLNNTRANLRVSTGQQNTFNVGKRTCNGLKPGSMYKGVCWSKQSKKFNAKSRHNNKHYCLLFSDSEHECAYAYNLFVRATQKDFAFINTLTQEIDPQRKAYIEARIAFKLKSEGLTT